MVPKEGAGVFWREGVPCEQPRLQGEAQADGFLLLPCRKDLKKKKN